MPDNVTHHTLIKFSAQDPKLRGTRKLTAHFTKPGNKKYAQPCNYIAGEQRRNE